MDWVSLRNRIISFLYHVLSLRLFPSVSHLLSLLRSRYLVLSSYKMGKLIPNFFNLVVVIYVALGSTACSYGMAIIGSTVGQPTFYTTFNMAPPNTPGYSKTASLISAFNGVNSAGSIFGAVLTAW